MKYIIFFFCLALTTTYISHYSYAQTPDLPKEALDVRNNIITEYDKMLIPIKNKYITELINLKRKLLSRGDNTCIRSVDTSLHDIKQKTGVTLSINTTDCRELAFVKLDYEKNSTDLLIATFNIYIDKLNHIKINLLAHGNMKDAMIIGHEIETTQRHIRALQQ